MRIRKQVRWFAERMEEKLAANDHKGGWLNQEAEDFLARMREEYRELGEALLRGDAPSAIGECADLANFAMMLAENLHRYGVISDGTLTALAMERLVKKDFYSLSLSGRKTKLF